MNRLNRKRITFLSLSLAVPVILLCVFVVYPFWELIHMSFLEWDGVASLRTFTGLDNYTHLFQIPGILAGLPQQFNVPSDSWNHDACGAGAGSHALQPL